MIQSKTINVVFSDMIIPTAMGEILSDTNKIRIQN